MKLTTTAVASLPAVADAPSTPRLTPSSHVARPASAHPGRRRASSPTSPSGVRNKRPPGGSSSPATSPVCRKSCRVTFPVDADRPPRRDTAAPHRTGCAACALLLQRACGLRIGELLDLEFDCVHEVPATGAWLKLPLGKLDTERMVPLDEETLALIDTIIATRSPGQPAAAPSLPAGLPSSCSPTTAAASRPRGRPRRT